jgi:hypothetical protein
MGSPINKLRSALAAGLAVWLAVLACLMGCAVPTLASSGPSNISTTKVSTASAASVHESSAEPGQPGVMADMPNCPHHSGGNAPAKHKGGEPVRGGGMSCCPVEVTVAAKPDIAALHISPAHSFVLEPHFSLPTVRFYHSAELVPSVWHSGRDTLLETHLLRI